MHLKASSGKIFKFLNNLTESTTVHVKQKIKHIIDSPKSSDMFTRLQMIKQAILKSQITHKKIFKKCFLKLCLFCRQHDETCFSRSLALASFRPNRFRWLDNITQQNQYDGNNSADEVHTLIGGQGFLEAQNLQNIKQTMRMNIYSIR